MNARHTQLPVATRRQQAQFRAAAGRANIAEAWADVERETVVLQARAHRAIDWTRTLSALAAIGGAIVALRRVVMRRRPGPALGAVAATTLLRRVVPSAFRLYLRRP
jgi:hypothetical protein